MKKKLYLKNFLRYPLPLMVVLGISSSLSGHSTGAWIATSKCSTKAWIFVSAWSTHDSMAVRSSEGIYIDKNKDGFVRNNNNNLVDFCSSPTTDFDGEKSAPAIGTTESEDYFRMTEWRRPGSFGLSQPYIMTSHTDPNVINGIKIYLANKGVDTSQITVTNIWVPGGSCTDLSIFSMMVIDLDVTQLQSGITRAHIATTTQDFLPCTNFMASPGCVNASFNITLTLPDPPPFKLCLCPESKSEFGREL